MVSLDTLITKASELSIRGENIPPTHQVKPSIDFKSTILSSSMTNKNDSEKKVDREQQ